MSLKKQPSKSKKAWKVTFTLPKEAALLAKDVKVLGDFNDWEPANALPMKVHQNLLQASLELAPGREYEFRYLINNERWENDPAADKYNWTPFGVENSVVVLPEILNN